MEQVGKRCLEEEEEGRKVRRKMDGDQLDVNREQLEKLIRDNSKMTEAYVTDLEDKVVGLQETLDGKVEEIEEKNELLDVNAAVMSKMNLQHKDKIQEMTTKLTKVEEKVENMETFEKCLIQTLLNPDVEELAKTVKLQQQRILELETKLKASAQLVETEANLEENVEEAPKETGLFTAGEAMLRLKGINVTLVRTEGGAEGPSRELPVQPESSPSPAQPSPRTSPSPVQPSPSPSPVQPEPAEVKPPTLLADILRANRNLTVLKGKVEVKTAEGSKSDLSEEDSEEEQEENTEGVPMKRDNWIEDEKKRRKNKREAREEKQTNDPFWGFSGPGSPLAKGLPEDGLGTKGLESEELDGEDRLMEECLECFRGWVHQCPEDLH